MVNTFALMCNSKIVTHMETWKVDSLVWSWEGLYVYAYPPTTLIRAVLSKKVADRTDLSNVDSTPVAAPGTVSRSDKNVD